MTDDRVRDAAERVQNSMDEILSNFRAGALITVLVRTPDKPAADFCMTSDDLDEVIAMVNRRKAGKAISDPAPQTGATGSTAGAEGEKHYAGESNGNSPNPTENLSQNIGIGTVGARHVVADILQSSCREKKQSENSQEPLFHTFHYGATMDIMAPEPWSMQASVGRINDLALTERASFDYARPTVNCNGGDRAAVACIKSEHPCKGANGNDAYDDDRSCDVHSFTPDRTAQPITGRIADCKPDGSTSADSKGHDTNSVLPNKPAPARQSQMEGPVEPIWAATSLYDLIMMAKTDGVWSVTDPEWVQKDFTATDTYKNLYAALTAPPPVQMMGLDWSNFDGPKRNVEWTPDDQDLIYTALNYRDDDYGDADEDVGQQLVERLLAAWKRTTEGQP